MDMHFSYTKFYEQQKIKLYSFEIRVLCGFNSDVIINVRK